MDRKVLSVIVINVMVKAVCYTISLLTKKGPVTKI